MTAKIIIATRESRLAMWQAEHVRDLLTQRFGAQVELLGMTRAGDQILDRTLSKVGGKGSSSRNWKRARRRTRDLAVHSLKDVPWTCRKASSWRRAEREDPRDAFVSNRFASLAELPQGGLVGTSSLRRVVQLRALRPDLRVEPLRGNLDTRTAQARRRPVRRHRARCSWPQTARSCIANPLLVRGGSDAAVRRARRARARSAIRRKRLLAQLDALTHRETTLSVHAERAVSRALGGSCSMPLAAFAQWAMTRSCCGQPWATRTNDAPLLHATAEAAVQNAAEARHLGERAAAMLREQGAAGYLGPEIATRTGLDQHARHVTAPAKRRRHVVDALAGVGSTRGAALIASRRRWTVMRV